MTIARAVQISILHTGLGALIGAAIEGLMPSASGASVNLALLETLVQAGLNGAAIAAVAGHLQAGDPTFGIPFSLALYQSQPAFGLRIEALSGLVTSTVAQAVPKKAASSAAA